MIIIDNKSNHLSTMIGLPPALFTLKPWEVTPYKALTLDPIKNFAGNEKSALKVDRILVRTTFLRNGERGGGGGEDGRGQRGCEGKEGWI